MVFPLIFCGFGIAIVAAGCGQSDGIAEQYPSRIEELAVDRARRDPVMAAQLRSRAVYGHYCARCHGANGEGDGFNSSMLKVPPRNLTDPKFRERVTEKHLTRTIRDGGPAVGKSVLMPAWGRTLSEKQIADVVAFLRTLKPLPKEEPAEESE
ncbi:MAG: c-type cytochrome [Planctomycetaceae bacterium]